MNNFTEITKAVRGFYTLHRYNPKFIKVNRGDFDAMLADPSLATQIQVEGNKVYILGLETFVDAKVGKWYLT